MNKKGLSLIITAIIVVIAIVVTIVITMFFVKNTFNNQFEENQSVVEEDEESESIESQPEENEETHEQPGETNSEENQPIVEDNPEESQSTEDEPDQNPAPGDSPPEITKFEVCNNENECMENGELFYLGDPHKIILRANDDRAITSWEISVKFNQSFLGYCTSGPLQGIKSINTNCGNIVIQLEETANNSIEVIAKVRDGLNETIKVLTFQVKDN